MHGSYTKNSILLLFYVFQWFILQYFFNLYWLIYFTAYQGIICYSIVIFCEENFSGNLFPVTFILILPVMLLLLLPFYIFGQFLRKLGR